MPNLIVERGKEKGATFDLRPDSPLVAGRDPASVNLVLSDPAASRRHFQVVSRDGRWYLADLGSRNHTYVNEEKVEKEVELASGDRIQVGETVLSFLDEDKADKAASQGLTGKDLGGYRILERIGRGGMGTVFKAKQISLNRVVALKVLAAKFARDPKFVEKFQSEARAAGQLNHPHVVQVFDVGQTAGLHHFSMEFMEGGCVQDLLSAREGGRLPWQEALPLIIDATRGLVFAEKRGIIHRDIKPDNLMLTSEMRVKIGDLGLAKRAEDGGGDKAIFGTPHFIAPEQAQGKEVTHAADIYALGTTFYRIVSGRTPFSGETVKEILRRQINDVPQPITELVPDFPDDLASILNRTMAKRVEDRYQSATKLLEDLEAFQLAHQIELSGIKKANKPLLYSLGALAIVLLGVAVWLWMRPKEVQHDTTIVTRTVEVPVGTTGPVKTPEEERAFIESQAKIARQDVQLQEPKGAISLAEKDLWLKIAEAYEALKKQHPDPRADAEVQLALKRANEIRTELERLDKERKELEQADLAWRNGVSDHVTELTRAKKWPDAIDYAQKQLADPDAKKRLPRLKGFDAELKAVAERVGGLADAELKDLLTQSKSAIDGGADPKPCLEKVEAWAAAIDASKTADEKLQTLARDAHNWVGDRRSELQDRLNEELAEDQAAYVGAVRAAHALQGAPLFDFDFAGAASQVELACKALKTYPFQERAAANVRHLREAQEAWAKWVELLASGKLFTEKEEIKGLPGVSSGTRCQLNLDEKPTTTKFSVVKSLGGASGRSFVEWADLTREDLATIFVLPKVDKLPGDVALGLSWAFVQLGHGNAASLLFERAVTAGANVSHDDETAIRREISALKAYDALRSKAPGGDPAELLAGVDAWRHDAEGTDSYVWLDGRPDKNLVVVPQGDVDRFIKDLGARPK